MRRKKRNSYKFTGKKQSKKGILSLCMTAASIAAGIAMIVISVNHKGEASVYIGSAGLLSMILALAAFVIGIGSLKEENSYKIVPVTGTVLSAISLFSWISVYVLGFYG